MSCSEIHIFVARDYDFPRHVIMTSQGTSLRLNIKLRTGSGLLPVAESRNSSLLLSAKQFSHLHAGKPFDMMISKPTIDCSIDAVSGEVHITQVLQVSPPA